MSALYRSMIRNAMGAFGTAFESFKPPSTRIQVQEQEPVELEYNNNQRNDVALMEIDWCQSSTVIATVSENHISLGIPYDKMPYWHYHTVGITRMHLDPPTLDVIAGLTRRLATLHISEPSATDIVAPKKQVLAPSPRVHKQGKSLGHKQKTLLAISPQKRQKAPLPHRMLKGAASGLINFGNPHATTRPCRGQTLPLPYGENVENVMARMTLATPSQTFKRAGSNHPLIRPFATNTHISRSPHAAYSAETPTFVEQVPQNGLTRAKRRLYEKHS